LSRGSDPGGKKGALRPRLFTGGKGGAVVRKRERVSRNVLEQRGGVFFLRRTREGRKGAGYIVDRRGEKKNPQGSGGGKKYPSSSSFLMTEKV